MMWWMSLWIATAVALFWAVFGTWLGVTRIMKRPPWYARRDRYDSRDHCRIGNPTGGDE